MRLAAGDDHLRESFPKWLEELDRRKLPSKKPPASADDAPEEGKKIGQG